MMKTLPASLRWSAILAAIPLFFATAPQAQACAACNFTFAREMDNERAGSLLERDYRRAFENQQSLPLAEIAGPHFFVNNPNPPVPGGTEEAEGAVGAEARAEPLAPELAAVADPAPAPAPAAGLSAARGALAAATLASPGNLPPRVLTPQMEASEFVEIYRRDFDLPLPATSALPQETEPDVSFTVTLHEGQTYLGNGVVYDGFLTDGMIPGPTIIVEEGDIVEMVIKNQGTIPHGASIHAAYTQTSKYLGQIQPNQEGRVVFQVNHPGVFLYHCAPGGHAIPMHVLFGQYGMMVVKPKSTPYQLEQDMGREPDLELFLTQHELYASGKGAIEGSADYVMFNGKLFRYIEEPISVRPGDFVRIYFLNVGPNLLSTFHIVGIVWDYVYWQGHPEAKWPGGQSVTAGPTDSWVIEFRIPPDEGAYTMLSHAVGSTARGAIGLLVADKDAETPAQVLSDGPLHTPEEMEEITAAATRVISPFKPGTHPVDEPVIYGPETKEVHVSIIGNSYWPKVIQVAPGTKVTWTNEEAFAYLAGEFSGVHNVAFTDLPPDHEGIVSPLLAHGERYSHVFDEPWEYEYICTPHPYMRARVIVKEPDYSLAGAGGREAVTASVGGWVIPALAVCFAFSLTAILTRGRRPAREED